jgi:rhodanese-related sulfurtransferase
MSPLAARKAEKLGYKKVKVFHAGLPAWKKAGNPVVSNIAAIEGYDKQDASYVLVDLRPGNVVEKGHIPKAVAVPTAGLDALKDQFPKYKAAAIILYTQHGDTKSADEAYKKIAGWGYTQVGILTGGFDAWEKAGKTVAKGPAQSKISYVRKLMPGEVDVETLKALLVKPAPDTMILDVRTAAEATDGLLPNAKNIPQEDLEKHIAELPKDKKIVLHCSTGVRAEMAYNLLKKAGLNAGYVKANVETPKDKPGEYSIAE